VTRRFPALEEHTNNDQIDDGIADAGRYHGNRNDSNRSGVLAGWL
jgi:hypothetical protein